MPNGLENGLLKPKVDVENFGELQTAYGNFAAAILLQVHEVDPTAPMDILAIGDDWFQLINTYSEPRNAFERGVAKQIGAKQFSDMWPIMQRIPGTKTGDIIAVITGGVVTGQLDRRVLEKIAVLDATKDIPPHDDDDLLSPQDTPWGANGVLRGTHTLVYHIRSGFNHQGIIEIPGDPNTDLSGRIVYPTTRKDL